MRLITFRNFLSDPSVRASVNIQHHTTGDTARLQIRENGVDVIERGGFDFSSCFAFCRKCYRFVEIMASADDRAAHRNPLEHHLENGRREVARWQPDEGDCALPSRKLKRLRERLRGGRGDENTVRTAARRL